MAVAGPTEVGTTGAMGVPDGRSEAVTRASAVLGPQVPRLAAEWAGDGLWQVVDGSLVFADISGFTALSERLARHGRIGAES